MLLIKNFKIIFRRAFQELRIRYSGSLLGLLWPLIIPLIFLIFYSLVQINVYKVKRPGLEVDQFVLMLFCGITTIICAAETLMHGATFFKRNKTLVNNLIIPIEILSLQSSLVSFSMCLFSIPIAISVALLLGHGGVYLLFAPIILLLQFLFFSGLSWVISIIGTLVKDIQYLLRFIALALLIVSPVSYTASMIPEPMEILVYSNPLSYFIFAYQSLLIFNQALPWR